jgi:hypothetical protein
MIPIFLGLRLILRKFCLGKNSDIRSIDMMISIKIEKYKHIFDKGEKT